MGHVRGGREAKQWRQKVALEQLRIDRNTPATLRNGHVLGSSQRACRIARVDQEIRALETALGVNL